jgi:hypothetical protein
LDDCPIPPRADRRDSAGRAYVELLLSSEDAESRRVGSRGRTHVRLVHRVEQIFGLRLTNVVDALLW